VAQLWGPLLHVAPRQWTPNAKLSRSAIGQKRLASHQAARQKGANHKWAHPVAFGRPSGSLGGEKNKVSRPHRATGPSRLAGGSNQVEHCVRSAHKQWGARPASWLACWLARSLSWSPTAAWRWQGAGEACGSPAAATQSGHCGTRAASGEQIAPRTPLFKCANIGSRVKCLSSSHWAPFWAPFLPPRASLPWTPWTPPTAVALPLQARLWELLSFSLSQSNSSSSSLPANRTQGPVKAGRRSEGICKPLVPAASQLALDPSGRDSFQLRLGPHSEWRQQRRRKRRTGGNSSSRRATTAASEQQQDAKCDQTLAGANSIARRRSWVMANSVVVPLVSVASKRVEKRQKPRVPLDTAHQLACQTGLSLSLSSWLVTQHFASLLCQAAQLLPASHRLWPAQCSVPI